MSYQRNRPGQEVSAGSMADIAFLLLIFFLVTTQILNDKGLPMVLPPKTLPVDTPINERNILKIQVNSLDRIMVEDKELHDISTLRNIVYDFVLNFGRPNTNKVVDGMSDVEVFNSLPPAMKQYIRQNLESKTSSDGPSKAIVSIKTDRGSSYSKYIEIMDEVFAAYYRIYGERVGLSAEDYRKLNRNYPEQRYLYEKGKQGINKAVSLADPSKQGDG
ncbi:ExbD/TolR family protein [Roseivirga thermotolerans]|uniref:Biopolymer transporter ExbD n=1 Tax=Roseivirga thermotolerans TaxID=1758176 RepID=A0ABQ3I8Z6_9BACT|nr:biopolymer transporter ExbD [Roseivirga thermotolerans]GHE65797.1 biopolymer transporter ExbD [Roseivirga thermotolerans]